MSCRHVTELISTAHDRSLTRFERLAMRTHLLTCRACRRYRLQLQSIRQLLRLKVEDIDMVRAEEDAVLSDEARERIRALLRA